MEQTIEYVVSLNLFGINALVNSKLRDAALAFHRAMTVVDTILQDETLLGRALSFKVKLEVPIVSSAAKAAARVDHNPYEVLDFPVHVAIAEYENYESPCAVSAVIDSISAALTFNLGLSLHLKGLNETNSQSDRLLDVLSIYERLLQSCGGTDKSDSPIGWRFVTVAAWNNLLHIRSHFLQTEKIKVCLRTLRTALLEYASSPEQLLPVTELVSHNLLLNSDAAWNTAPVA